MIYLILLIFTAGFLCVAALYLGGSAGRTALGRVAIAVVLGTLMSALTLIAARLAGVANTAPVADRLLGWGVVAGALLLLVGLIELATARLHPARGIGWLAVALVLMVGLADLANLWWLGTPMLWQLVDFGAVGAVAAFAWWAALPPAGPSAGRGAS